MAIVFNEVPLSSKRRIQFDDLECGDIFKCDSNRWYMKTYNIYDEDGDVSGNAIRLSDGVITNFDNNYEIIKLNKKVVFDYSSDDLVKWL